MDLPVFKFENDIDISASLQQLSSGPMARNREEVEVIKQA